MTIFRKVQRLAGVSHIKHSMTRRAFLKACAMSWMFGTAWKSKSFLRVNIDDGSYSSGAYSDGPYLGKSSRIYLPIVTNGDN